MEHEALIFDCDGTLTDSMPLHFLSWRDTLAKHGLSFPEQRFYAMAGMPSESIIETLSEEQGVPANADEISEEKENCFLESLHLLQPIRHCFELVREYCGQLPLAVASGGIRPVVVRQLETIGLKEAFDAIVTAEDTERHKPEPDVFLKAAELLKVAPQGCCVYEDSDLGIQAAQSAGMQWVDIREFHSPKLWES